MKNKIEKELFAEAKKRDYPLTLVKSLKEEFCDNKKKYDCVSDTKPSFSIDMLEKQLEYSNACTDVHLDVDSKGNRFCRFVKKVIMKLNNFWTSKLLAQISFYNTSSNNCMHQIVRYIRETDKREHMMMMRIEELENEIKAMKGDM